MFSRILIACRGEIALRIIRTCRRMGIETVAVYSEADRNSSHLRLADAAVCIGEAPPAKSYLNIPAIISAAEISDVDALHPGYGFLAENAHFVDVCRSCQIEFIGPTSAAISKMGNKSEARKIAKQIGVPVIPGSEDLIRDDKEALDVAHSIGYPVLVKPVAGGGGRGMRIAHNDMTLINAMMASRAEAEVSFGDSSVYIEKCIQFPRHVEVQVLADHYGAVVTLGERDCSIMRRYQKLIEECPSPGITPEMREILFQDAVKVARAVEYTNAGTVEFLIDENGKHYFIEMNTRIQVEHPVTEMVTGLDLVEQQIRVAYGQPTVEQKNIHLNGVAIECRINAEDPKNDFTPRAGNVGLFMPPIGEGIRVDTHVYGHYNLPSNYDSLLAKVIAHGPTRQVAIDRMRRALEEFILDGIPSTIDFHFNVLNNARFLKGDYNTGFVSEMTMA